jgi:hypothetical protein
MRAGGPADATWQAVVGLKQDYIATLRCDHDVMLLAVPSLRMKKMAALKDD